MSIGLERPLCGRQRFQKGAPKIFITLARKKVANLSASLIVSSPLVGTAGEIRTKAAFDRTA